MRRYRHSPKSEWPIVEVDIGQSSMWIGDGSCGGDVRVDDRRLSTGDSVRLVLVRGAARIEVNGKVVACTDAQCLVRWSTRDVAAVRRAVEVPSATGNHPRRRR